MRTLYKKILDDCIREQLFLYRINNNLTQSQMADLLRKDYRSYVDIEHGHNGCSCITFVLFLLYIESKPMDFLQSLSSLFQQANENVA